MTDQNRLQEFCHAWMAGARPSVEALLADTPAGEREAVRREVERFLLDAPIHRGGTSDAQLVREADHALSGCSGSLPLLLPALRRQARMPRAMLASLLASRLGYDDAHERVHQHLHALEAGTLEAERVDSKVLDTIARILEIPAQLLADAAAVATLRVVDETHAVHRGFAERPPFSEVPDDYGPLPEPLASWQAIDRLFLG